MRTILKIQVRAFPVTVRDRATGQEREELIVLDKARLQAAQLVGQSSFELINRLCVQKGLAVLRVGKAEKREVTVNLNDLFTLQSLYSARSAKCQQKEKGMKCDGRSDEQS